MSGLHRGESGGRELFAMIDRNTDFVLTKKVAIDLFSRVFKNNSATVDRAGFRQLVLDDS